MAIYGNDDVFSCCSLIFVNIHLYLPSCFVQETLCSLRFATQVCQHAKNGVHCVCAACCV